MLWLWLKTRKLTMFLSGGVPDFHGGFDNPEQTSLSLDLSGQLSRDAKN